MYTKRVYPFKDLMYWTRWDILKFTIIAAIPVVLYAILDIKILTLPWLPIALVGTALAFIVGFKNNVSYDRLWEARKVWGGIVNTSRSFSLYVNDMVDAKEGVGEEELAAIKLELINRHIAWMVAHRYALRQGKPWEQFIKNKSNKEYSERHPLPEDLMSLEDALKPYLSELELKRVLGVNNKAAAILNLQSRNLKELKEKGYVWEFSHLEMENLLVELFTLQGKNERIKNFPYPRQFATLNFAFVWIFILLLPFGIMGSFDKMGVDLLEFSMSMKTGWLKTISILVSSHFVWLSIPFCVIISWVFHTMERVGEVSENPFEGTSNDVPITTMSRAIEIDMLQMLGDDKVVLPEPIQEKHNIQM